MPGKSRTTDEGEAPKKGAQDRGASGDFVTPIERAIELIEVKEFIAAYAAISEAVASQLPGREHGPADAYRHLIWSAEMTRRFGEDRARKILELHEQEGRAGGRGFFPGVPQTPEQEAMDRHNNDIGIRIGTSAETFEDVITASRSIMSNSPRDGTGPRNGRSGSPETDVRLAATWLAESEWVQNPMFEAGQPGFDPANPKKRKSVQESNWHTNPNNKGKIDWVNGLVPDEYQGKYPFAGARFRFSKSDSTVKIDRIMPFLEAFVGLEEARNRVFDIPKDAREFFDGSSSSPDDGDLFPGRLDPNFAASLQGGDEIEDTRLDGLVENSDLAPAGETPETMTASSPAQDIGSEPMDRDGEWKIESRQGPLEDNAIGDLVGHNYLALVGPNGKVVEELHGWFKEPFLKPIRVKNGAADTRRQRKDSAPVTSAGFETRNTPLGHPNDEKTSKVVRAGTEKAVRNLWEDALVKADKLDKKKIVYSPFEENSKTFWATMLRAMKIDPEKEDVHPRSDRLTPGSMMDLKEWRSDPSKSPDRKNLSELDSSGRTRFAEEDRLPLPFDLAQIAVATARRRRRRRRRHGQLS